MSRTVKFAGVPVDGRPGAGPGRCVRAARSARTPAWRVAVAVVTILGAVGSAPSEAAAEPVPTEGAGGFYAAPEPGADARAGAVIRTEPMTVGAAGAPIALDARRILYWSTDPHGGTVAVSGLLFQSHSGWPGGGARPVVAIGPGTVGQGDQCAPSKFLSNLADPATPGAVMAQYEVRLALELTGRGINVVMTDYQGMGTAGVHPYVNRVAQGAAVLDAVRAATRMPATGSGPDSRIGVWGYSQGGGAAAAAMEMAASYAPELQVVAGYGGAVPADLRDTLARIDGSVLSGAVGYALNGFRAVYPDIADLIEEYTNDYGKSMLATVAGQCLFQTAAQYGMHRSSEFTSTGETLVEIVNRTPQARRVIDENRLGAVAPSGTFWLDSATSDDIVPYPQAEALARSWCGLGGHVRFVPQAIPDVLPRSGVGHLAPQHVQWAAAQQWLTEMLAGRTDTGTCG
ncbi:lipase family protein [Nocardia blacklockiae]|uniref:lipase family protein n=1 Tax=Nocardia blacklockiae TaxID=480036 RepID=UPI0018951574|nr:lipase family protein [Nocardia blacklockiae]MBF6171036.1 lipase [Nocardia blacklockiae]